MYAEDRSPWGINIGQTVTQAKSGLLADWVTNTFGAQHQEPMDMPVGTVITGVWRPGLYYETDVFQALQTDRIERRSAEQALHQLVERLTDLLLYVEPEGAGLDSYGPKGRELLILAATEAENAWASYMQLGNVGATGQGYSTNDYVRLLKPLHLDEYQARLSPYAAVPPVGPFNTWDSTKPTQSLLWYDAYNKTKHNRQGNLHLATVRRCIEAVRGQRCTLLCSLQHRALVRAVHARRVASQPPV
jgi:hypothetical protein